MHMTLVNITLKMAVAKFKVKFKPIDNLRLFMLLAGYIIIYKYIIYYNSSKLNTSF